jgi:hypothetical protein
MPQIIDCVFVSTEPYTELGRGDRSPEECRRFCLDVNSYATHLELLGFRDDEMPRPLIHVYRVSELVIRTEPVDDILDFFIHIKCSQTLVEETISALEEIGADAHARFLTSVNSYLKSIQYKLTTSNVDEIHKAIAKATQDHLSSDILQQRYGNFGVDGDDDGERRLYSICLDAIKYLERRTNLKRVPDGAHNQEELNRYFASKPAIVLRLKEIENARPWEQLYIERAMRGLGCKLLQFGRFLRDDDKHWSWHFWTDQGRGFAIFDQAEMIIFRTGMPEVFFRADNPVVWTREAIPELLSGAPRNEPEIAPSEVPASTTMAMPGTERTRRLDLPPIW